MLMQSGSFLAGVMLIGVRELVGACMTRRDDVCWREEWAQSIIPEVMKIIHLNLKGCISESYSNPFYESLIFFNL